jgi:hypothetical protein
LIGNAGGDLVLFQADGSDAPTGTPIRFAEWQPGMQVRDVVVSSDSVAYVGLGGFHPDPRAGLLAVVNLAGGPNIVFEQPVDAVGLSGPVVALDEDRGVVYTNAVIDSGTRIDIVGGVLSGSPYRMHSRTGGDHAARLGGLVELQDHLAALEAGGEPRHADVELGLDLTVVRPVAGGDLLEEGAQRLGSKGGVGNVHGGPACARERAQPSRGAATTASPRSRIHPARRQ